jgi:uncharacterized protein (DUF934 family)
LSIGDILADHLHRPLELIEGDVAVVISIEHSAGGIQSVETTSRRERKSMAIILTEKRQPSPVSDHRPRLWFLFLSAPVFSQSTAGTLFRLLSRCLWFKRVHRVGDEMEMSTKSLKGKKSTITASRESEFLISLRIDEAQGDTK